MGSNRMTGQPPSMSPPMAAETRLPEQKSSWPTVVGVIGIVLASLGLLSSVCGGIWLAVQPLLPPEFTASQPDLGRAYVVMQIVGYVVALPMSIWLLVASIGVMKRRAGSGGGRSSTSSTWSCPSESAWRSSSATSRESSKRTPRCRRESCTDRCSAAWRWASASAWRGRPSSSSGCRAGGFATRFATGPELSRPRVARRGSPPGRAPR